MAEWTTKYVNSLPDSSFAWIDSDGNRHLPYKDADGKVDHNHTANALARLNQVKGMSSDERDKVRAKLQSAMKSASKMEASIFRASPIQLSADGELPSRIMLMQSGNWPNSVKGDFSISVDDLKEIKNNFDSGVGFPTDDASTGLAIDFKHEYADEAAAWIKGLELSVDAATGEAKLFANPIEWTDSGEAAVRGGRFKCVSPSGYFGRKGTRMSAWSNPTNLTEKVKNVLDGAGLTNIPFLRGMSPVRASATDDIDNELEYDKVIFVRDSQKIEEKPTMTIDALRVKEKDQLSTEDMKFITEHKDELSADELKKFGLEADERVSLSAEDKETLDAIKSGKKKLVDSEATVVGKDQLDGLMRTTQEYREERVKTTLDKHVARGAIKQDQAKLDGYWGKQLLNAASDDERKEIEVALDALSDNKDLASEVGSGADVAAGTTAREQLSAIAADKVAAAEKDGKTLLFGDALKQAARENQDLQKQDLLEMGVN